MGDTGSGLDADEAGACVPVALIVLLDGDLVQTPEHLGVAYLLSALRAEGLEGRILAVEPGQDEQALAELRQLSPRLVGLSLTTVSVPRAVSFGRRLRELLGTAHLTAGGPLATFLGEKLLLNPAWDFLDSLVRGEGERPIVALARALLAGQPLSTVPSLTYREAESVRSNALAPVVHELDALPWPARDQLRSLRSPPPYVRISTSRGCTSRCTFCNAPHAGNVLPGGKVWRGRTPGNVVAELEQLIQTLGVRTFDFVDSTFEDPGGTPKAKERLRQLAQLLIERGLTVYFNCCMQAQNWSEEDEELISLLARAGLEKVLVGLESGSDRGLARWRKRARQEDNQRVVRLLRKHGIYVAFGYIMFHPHVGAEELRESAGFLRGHLGHNLRRYTTRLELYPGAEEVERLRAEGLLLPEYDVSLNPFAYRFRDEEMGRLSETLARLAGDEYARRGTLQREPSYFAFETFDITLHTFLSRLKRACGQHPVAHELLVRLEQSIGQIKEEMAGYNLELFHHVWGLVREAHVEEAALASLRSEVEARFTGWMSQLRGLQLRTGMALRRGGVSWSPTALGAAPPA
jgi:anaerobic magnesium-protoporphyrin IX monomethyl ester cyclase